MTKLWTVKITTFLIWALAAGSAAFWVLQNLAVSSSDATSAAQMMAASSPKQNGNLTPQVAMALGAANPVVPTTASALAAMQARFQLQGIVANGTRGAVLISVDGKPAKSYRVGAAIEDGLEVTSVKPRSAAIGANGAKAFTLELPLKK
jgi:general secretion pathway protein C